MPPFQILNAIQGEFGETQLYSEVYYVILKTIEIKIDRWYDALRSLTEDLESSKNFKNIRLQEAPFGTGFTPVTGKNYPKLVGWKGFYWLYIQTKQ